MIVGVDLAGSEKRNTGVAFFQKGIVKTFVVKSDGELMEICRDFRLIFVDAPLSIPKGRKNIDDRGEHFRECDRELRRRGIKFFPVTLGPMRQLTKRAINLKGLWESEGKRVYETYPGAFYDLMGVPRKDKQAILSFYRSFLKLEEKAYTQDELDAVACLVVGLLFNLGLHEVIGGEDGTIVLPKSQEALALLRGT